MHNIEVTNEEYNLLEIYRQLRKGEYDDGSHFVYLRVYNDGSGAVLAHDMGEAPSREISVWYTLDVPVDEKK